VTPLPAPAAGPFAARLLGPGFLTAALLLGAAAWGPGPLAAQEPSEAVAYCLMCHEDEGLTMDLDDGESMSLFVPADALVSSVHGKELECTDCHQGFDNDEAHPSGATFGSRREYVQRSYEVCRQCHFDTYTRTLESIHFTLLEKGRQDVPVCTDCHGAHAIADPHDKRAMLSRSCGECHAPVLEQYARSVHGKALMEDGVEAVPSCVDCHTAHSIADARTVGFHLSSPEICINCHGDAERMKPFDLSADVATTYLSDFHGVTATLADPDQVEERHLVVTCVDCHGVHDIASPALVGETAMTARVQRVCADCHQGAGTDLPAAWLSHFRPSLEHAPLVYLIDLFYKLFIPFAVGGLALQVALHLYRVAVRR
jgi:nitrate/TMAO reductase-like tetraheme cytochrome c subunit